VRNGIDVREVADFPLMDGPIPHENPKLKGVKKCLPSAWSSPNVKTSEKDQPVFSQTCLLTMRVKLAKCKCWPDYLRFASE
jgi:hypothetical protein